MESYDIRGAVETDQKWVAKLFDKNKEILGYVSGGTVFWRWLQDVKKHDRHQFLVIPEVAFAHFLVKKTGEKVLYEMAVDPEQKRKGLGRKLLDRIGRPLTLKTDADNVESNSFYVRYGMRLMGTTEAASGKRLNIYQNW